MEFRINGHAGVGAGAVAETCNIFALLLFRLIIMLSKSRRIDSNGVQICTPLLRAHTYVFQLV